VPTEEPRGSSAKSLATTPPSISPPLPAAQSGPLFPQALAQVSGSGYLPPVPCGPGTDPTGGGGIGFPELCPDSLPEPGFSPVVWPNFLTTPLHPEYIGRADG